MGKISLAVAAAIATSAAIASPACAAELITNGNFDAGLAGWTVTPGGVFSGNPDILALKGADYIANAGATGSQAASDNTFASFGPGDKFNASVLLQNPFATVANTVYKLSFDYAQFLGAPGQELLKYAITGTGAGSASIIKAGVESQTGGTNLDTIFQKHTVYFTGTGSPLNLQFSLFGSSSNSADGLLDNVSITAVPEASTWAMFILGFGALGVSLRRRKQQATVIA
ncbi:MAG: hypothetical protein JWO15_1730 [Sphingomonadales bacterium]|nr:hypothetical protein [Sphingomonadales bacterium]